MNINRTQPQIYFFQFIHLIHLNYQYHFVYQNNKLISGEPKFRNQQIQKQSNRQMYRQPISTKIPSKLVSNVSFTKIKDGQIIRNNAYNGQLTVVGEAKIKIKQQAKSNQKRQTKTKIINKNEKKEFIQKQIESQQNEVVSIWEFRIYEINNKNIKYYRLPSYMNQFMILGYVAISELIYAFWVYKQTIKEEQQKIKQQLTQIKAHQQFLYCFQIPHSTEDIKANNGKEYPQLKLLHLITLNNKQENQNNKKQENKIDLNLYSIKRNSISLVNINSGNSYPNYLRLVEEYNYRQKQVYPVDLITINNFNFKPSLKPYKIIRIRYINIRGHQSSQTNEMSDISSKQKHEDKMKIGQVWTYQCAILSLICNVLIIDPVILNQKSKINKIIDKQKKVLGQQQKQRPSRYKPLIISYLNTPSYPISLLNSSNDRRITLYLHCMGYNYLAWPNFYDKIYVDGYSLSLDLQEVINTNQQQESKINNNLQIQQQSGMVNQNKNNGENNGSNSQENNQDEQNDQNQEQEQVQNDIIEIIVSISEQKQKPIQKQINTNSLMRTKKLSSSSILGSSKKMGNSTLKQSSINNNQILLQSSLICTQSNRDTLQLQQKELTQKNKMIYLVVQTEYNKKCKLIRILLNLQQMCANVLKRCCFYKNVVSDVFIDSRYVSGYILLTVCSYSNQKKVSNEQKLQYYMYVYALNNYHFSNQTNHSCYDRNNLTYIFINQFKINSYTPNQEQLQIFNDFNDKIKILQIYNKQENQSNKNKNQMQQQQQMFKQISMKLHKQKAMKQRKKKKKSIHLFQLCTKKAIYMQMLEAFYCKQNSTTQMEKQKLIQVKDQYKNEEVYEQIKQKGQQEVKQKQVVSISNAAFVQTIAKYMLELL